MRIAWFSPLPPVGSGIAAYSAELLRLLDRDLSVDRFVDRTSGTQTVPPIFDAHDFVWKQQRAPYDLVVYQLGNAPCHDYIWAYLARYPGLVVLHDVRLHHARARQLLNQKRFDDYRREFRYDHPDAPADAAEYAVEGLGGSVYYMWPMLRVVIRMARAVAVHNRRVADDLRESDPDIAVDVIRMGVPPNSASRATRMRVRPEIGLADGEFVFATFGKVTAEKRIDAILRALADLNEAGTGAFLLVVGDAGEYPTLADDIARLNLRDHVRVTGYVPDERVSEFLAAADACLCLRWPTAGESSASWLRCLAAAKPTVMTDLAHQVDVPTLNASTWRRSHSSREPVAIAIDLLDERGSLHAAMSRLMVDRTLREELSRGAHDYWAREHALELMAEDYRRLLAAAARRAAPRVDDLPGHFTNDHTQLAQQIAGRLELSVDILKRPGTV